ncbi:plasmid mobilization relaxosome protein MobC [Acutalibacter sp. 1XD8-33]|nr:plasmid mobilization relaxosome protein MobC [Acutalibacter sp. 1XD8-33]
MEMEPLIRQLILGVDLRPRPPGEYAALLRELSVIGNNVNQIAYWANSCRCISEGDIQEAVALVKQAWRLVREAL